MVLSTWKRGGLAVTAAALAVGLAGCGGGSTDKGAAAGPTASKTPAAAAVKPAEAVDAAYKKVTGAKSAKFTMTMKTPKQGGGSQSLGMSGTIGWNPVVMDMSMDTSALGADAAGMPPTLRAEMIGATEYIDMGADFAKQTDGKRWMKIDIVQTAKDSGAGDLSGVLGNELQNSNQDPSSQLGLLQSSSDIKRIGSETLDGTATDHYQGTFTPEQITSTGTAAQSLTPAQRKQFSDAMKKAGITSERVDVWVGKDNYPVRVDVSSTTAQGPISMSMRYSDYSAQAATVQAPPAGQTVDLQDMIKQMSTAASAG